MPTPPAQPNDSQSTEDSLSQDKVVAQQLVNTEYCEPHLADDVDDEPNISAPEVTKGRVVKSMLWSALEMYSSQIIQFVVSIFMARILTPNEYGIIGIIGVFLAISSTFIDSGLGTALVQKKNCTRLDFNTVFVTNFTLSSVCFLILFFAAPAIANFYEIEDLTWTTRAMALTFIIGSFATSSNAALTKALAFKQMAMVTLVCNLLTGALGIALAYNGFGVWALVFQAVGGRMLSTIWIISISPIKPKFKFSSKSFRELFGFGCKLLGSNLIFTLFNNLYNLVIGKAFNATALGFFSRADGYSALVSNNISGLLGKVLLPSLSRIQDDDVKLQRFYNKATTTATFYICGAYMLFAGLAKPIIVNTISAKWLDCVPLLQVLCYGAILNHIQMINSNFLICKGFPGAFLKMQVLTKPFMVLALLAAIPFGLQEVAYGRAASNMFTTIVSYYYFRKLTPFSITNSVYNSFKLIVIAVGLSVISLIAFNHLESNWINLLLGLAILSGTYLLITRIITPETFKESMSIKKTLSAK